MTISPIAQGAFSQVVRARRPNEPGEYAVKSWVRSKLFKDKALAAAMRTEIEALQEVRSSAHPHVANIVDLLENPQATHCVLEYCGGGSVLRFLQSKGHGIGMEEKEAVPIIAQVRSDWS